MPLRRKNTNVQYLKSSSKSKDSSDFVLIGKIVAAHGIKGAVKVVSYAETPAPFHCNQMLWMTVADGTFNPLKIDWCKPHKRGIRLRLSGVINRNQAETLIGQELFINKTQLPQLEQDTYYWIDLIGLSVKTTADECIGYIDAIIPTGASDVYVIRRTDGHEETECLLPAVANFILNIDLDRRTMTVKLPEGL